MSGPGCKSGQICPGGPRPLRRPWRLQYSGSSALWSPWREARGLIGQWDGLDHSTAHSLLDRRNPFLRDGPQPINSWSPLYYGQCPVLALDKADSAFLGMLPGGGQKAWSTMGPSVDLGTSWTYPGLRKRKALTMPGANSRHNTLSAWRSPILLSLWSLRGFWGPGDVLTCPYCFFFSILKY